ncbi:acyl-CoA desaturase [Pseudomonas sp. PB103]|jgi:stearoyl-CoA desaturase (delta-9 desaturase)|uniref:acyl-CoA desaturase n=1 Tax=unclassified Pseudomonas TaxID=196821 RepID=UPI00131BBBC8|nr:acyl-CoA desaturase [Pseudomonas sp. PB103]KAE9648879.1 acyl-CoA desaturase [Pseudomonas sp. PB103]
MDSAARLPELDQIPQDKSQTKDVKRKAISSPYFHRLQRKHFLMFDVLPVLGVILAGIMAFYIPVSGVDIGLFIAFWALTGIGVSVGYHRYFTHRSFKARPAVAVALTILGSMAGQGALLSWVAMHRRHHELSDQPGDPHSPNLQGPGFKGLIKGLVHSHFTWMKEHDYPNVAYYAPDLIRDPLIAKTARHYYTWVILGLVAPAILGGLLSQSLWGVVSGFLWGGAVRMFVVGHIIWSINSLLHRFGTRPYQSRDHSRNGGLFGLFTFGESWHNNHHAFPESPSFGLQWAAFDPGYWFIRGLSLVGLTWDLRVPTVQRRTSRKKRNVQTQQ